jgi:hypothetical protein
MRYVELIKGIDYIGRGIKAKRGQKLTVEEPKAAELVATGLFKDAGEVVNVDEVKGEEPKAAELVEQIAVQKPVSKMNAEELRAYAESKDYDISECTKVAEIRALIAELDSATAKDVD